MTIRESPARQEQLELEVVLQAPMANNSYITLKNLEESSIAQKAYVDQQITEVNRRLANLEMNMKSQFEELMSAIQLLNKQQTGKAAEGVLERPQDNVESINRNEQFHVRSQTRSTPLQIGQPSGQKSNRPRQPPQPEYALHNQYENVEDFEDEFDQEEHHYKHYRANHQRGRDGFKRVPPDDITKKVKVEAPEFDGRLDPSIFLDWLAGMEDYFEWYDMNDTQKVRFAKMKLVGSARKYWQNAQRIVERQGLPPLERWQEMKAKLKEKYVPLHYRTQLYNKFLNLKQESNASDYVSQFDDLMIRCDVDEEEWRIIARFINGLKPYLQKELKLNFPESLEEAFQKAAEVESLLQYAPVRRANTQSISFRQSRGLNSIPEPPSKPNSSQATSWKGYSAKPNESIGSSSRPNNSFIECFRCHSKGHIASRCPQRALILESHPEGEDEADADIVVDPAECPSDVDEEIIIDEQGYETRHLGVMRCILSVPLPDDSWKRKSIFHTFVKCGDKSCKLVIDGGSSSNVISYQGVTRLGLKMEPHPEPFRVAWVDKISLPVTQQCHVPLQFGDYKEEILCDVIPMDVAHILLGRPWLYDHNVTNFGRENTYSFKHNDKTILSRPAKPDNEGKQSRKSKGMKLKRQSLHLLTEKQFLQESKENAVVIAVVAKLSHRVASIATSEVP